MAIDTTLPRLEVSAPALQPLGYGLLSVATEVVRDDPHAQFGVWFEPRSGVTGGIITLSGTQVVGGAMVPETFDGSTQPGSFPTIFTNPFLIYAGVQAHPVGHTIAELQDRASAKLALNAERWIEQGLATGASGGAQLTAVGAVLAGTAAAPTAVTASVGLGLLESWIGSAVGAAGVIHAPRAAAPALWNQLAKAGPRQQTAVLGTPVAVGRGYAGATPVGAPAPAAGTAWLYATGPVLVNRSATQLRDVPAGGKTSLAQQVPLTTTYATEVVSVGYEAGCAAVLVTL